MPQKLPIPGGIKDLSGEAKDGFLFLVFSVPAKDSSGAELKDLAGFRILKSCGSCMGGFEPFKEIRLEEKEGYTIANGKLYVYDDDLKNGFQYAYRVHPVTRLGTAGEASNTFFITWHTPPLPPARVVVTARDGRVEISWNRENDLLYNVYKGQDGVYPLFPVNKNPLATPLFIDSGLENGKVYRYEVRSVMVKDGTKWEGDGIKVEAVPLDLTPPEAPQEIKTVKAGAGVWITWKANKEADLLGYNVYRIIGGKTEQLNKEPITEPEFLDRKVPDVRYLSYYVTAVDKSNNESLSSKEAIIIMKE